jgi:hypothetical protein
VGEHDDDDDVLTRDNVEKEKQKMTKGELHKILINSVNQRLEIVM